MINVAAIISIKNWPFTATFGFSSLFYYLLAAIFFFLPVSFIAAELATGWPEKGGIFVWVKEAFGQKLGFLAVWLLWIENVAWYPTILSFIAATIAYIFNPALAENKMYIFLLTIILFWASTFANFFGMKASGWVSSIGAICGTFVPAVLIISLGMAWYFGGNPSHISFTWDSLIPNLTSFDQMVFFTGILLSLAGMEMSAVHAKDVQSPQKNYPKAILLSASLILILSILGVLSIALVIPNKEINLVAGTIQAISLFLKNYNLEWSTPFIAALLAIGGIGSVATWIIGPTKGLLAAAEYGNLPKFFRKTNQKGAPIALLFVQGLIVTSLSFLFFFVPTISSGFWTLTALVAQLYLLMYLLMFAAAIKLRYSKPHVPREYKIPGGKFGIWMVSSLGILGSVFALIIGFLPPEHLGKQDTLFHVSFLMIGIVVACLLPFLFHVLKRKRLS